MSLDKNIKSQFKHSGDEKKHFVEKMFDDISPNYDFLNRLLSFGIDIYWRKRFIESLNIQDKSTLLDVACGTGDIGFSILKKYNIRLINIDISSKMLEQAEKKAQNNNISDIKFIKGDAEKLPLEDNSVDYLSIAYGFRNIGHYDIALKEFYRVLKPGGTLGILEFSKPRVKIAGSIFNCYFHHVLPRVGSLFSRTDAYQYLPESVDFFPTRKSICDKIENAGFQKTSFLDLTFGISTIFSAYKDA